MSTATLTRPAETTASVSPSIEGAAVYDAEGYRLGLVEATDPRAGSFTLLEAGYLLGSLARTHEVPAAWIRRANSERVELAVPARAMELAEKPT
jgi:hypothetical protein